MSVAYCLCLFSLDFELTAFPIIREYTFSFYLGVQMVSSARCHNVIQTYDDRSIFLYPFAKYFLTLAKQTRTWSFLPSYKGGAGVSGRADTSSTGIGVYGIGDSRGVIGTSNYIVGIGVQSFTSHIGVAGYGDDIV